MSKIWIKPKRRLFVGDTALQENKVVELPESEANELLKNGWAEVVEKPKNKGKSANPPANQDDDPPPLDNGESQGLGEPSQQPEE